MSAISIPFLAVIGSGPPSPHHQQVPNSRNPYLNNNNNNDNDSATTTTETTTNTAKNNNKISTNPFLNGGMMLSFLHHHNMRNAIIMIPGGKGKGGNRIDYRALGRRIMIGCILFGIFVGVSSNLSHSASLYYLDDAAPDDFNDRVLPTNRRSLEDAKSIDDYNFILNSEGGTTSSDRDLLGQYYSFSSTRRGNKNLNLNDGGGGGDSPLFWPPPDPGIYIPVSCSKELNNNNNDNLQQSTTTSFKTTKEANKKLTGPDDHPFWVYVNNDHNNDGTHHHHHHHGGSRWDFMSSNEYYQTSLSAALAEVIHQSSVAASGSHGGGSETIRVLDLGGGTNTLGFSTFLMAAAASASSSSSSSSGTTTSDNVHRHRRRRITVDTFLGGPTTTKKSGKNSRLMHNIFCESLRLNQWKNEYEAAYYHATRQSHNNSPSSTTTTTTVNLYSFGLGKKEVLKNKNNNNNNKIKMNQRKGDNTEVLFHSLEPKPPQQQQGEEEEEEEEESISSDDDDDERIPLITTLDRFAQQRGWFDSHPDIVAMRVGSSSSSTQDLDSHNNPILGAVSLIRSHLIRNIFMEISATSDYEIAFHKPGLRLLVLAGYKLHRIGGGGTNNDSNGYMMMGSHDEDHHHHHFDMDLEEGQDIVDKIIEMTINEQSKKLNLQWTL